LLDNKVDLERRAKANDEELARVKTAVADCACTRRSLSENMKKLCGELALLEDERAVLNQTTRLLDMQGMKPMTEAELAEHRRAVARHNARVTASRHQIAAKAEQVDLLLSRGDACRLRSADLEKKRADLEAARTKLIREGAVLAGKITSHRQRIREQDATVRDLRGRTDSFVGDLGTARKRAAALTAGRRTSDVSGRLHQAVDDATKAEAELRHLSQTSEKRAQSLRAF
jgi:chromosome segregation ATPase